MFKPFTLQAYFGIAAVLAVMLALPVLSSDPYLMHVMVLAMIFGIFASAWNLVAGFAGLKTFGHHAFFGLGAYGSALLSIHMGLSPWITLWLGGLIAAAAGLLIGTPILRIRSMPHVAIVTLGFAEIVRICIANFSDLTRGEMGLWGIPQFNGFSLPLVGNVAFGPADKVSFYYLALALSVLMLIIITHMMRSKTGLAMLAMRDSEDAAESLGVNLTQMKLMVFGLSAFIVGVAGAFYAHYLSILTPNSVVGIDLMISIIAMVLVGGLGTVSGPLVGALVLTVLIEAMRDIESYRMLGYGLLIVVIVMYLPRGLVTIRERLFPRPQE
ncbi:branched-chain amino acid ABC transporter permease [Falsochrobactrum sp. TDYN1]|uniref:Branched-chain amino acid ABC transporter permease n=1 Tax=Falsochrobactrum tianjinense TaxID=2706015 RepID=A0A949UW61_9HYPH|nr:branched-chain amino acid ABC transporter permease [Falsochrobactrum sp. TDYN1]MBV2144961.1 branched-chain amino acid ABC transporter permease [Falsochrobactrum sp. TDYN1]